MMQQQQISMRCKVPYPLPYILLLVFTGLAFVVNILYYDLDNGVWSPLPYRVEPQLFRQRPYQVIVFVLDSIAALIFVIYIILSPQSQNTQNKMVIRWFLHIVAFSFILLIWMLDISQLWIYKILLFDFKTEQRVASNTDWKDPFFTIMYSVTIAYGLLVAIPCMIYLLYFYFVQAQNSYKQNPINVHVHKVFNKICYFATYISIIVITAVNLSFLPDYEYYFTTSVYPFNPTAYLTFQMALPVIYLQYVFTGLALLFAAFLFIKQIFQTMRSKKKHIRRQLLVLTSTMVCIGILTIHKIIQVYRMNEVIKLNVDTPGLPFLVLYDHTKDIMWSYLFLLFPLGIYSIRNYWRQWKRQYASGQATVRGTQYNRIEEDVPQQNKEGTNDKISKTKNGHMYEEIEKSNREA